MHWAVWTGAKSAKTDVFVYYWDHALPGPDADLHGAFHTSEVPHVMAAIDQTVDRKLTAEDHTIADTVSSYWANFIETGNPNGMVFRELPRYRVPRQIVHPHQCGFCGDAQHACTCKPPLIQRTFPGSPVRSWTASTCP